MRVDSSAEAHRKTSRPENSMVLWLSRSITSAPVAQPSSYRMLRTTLFGRNVMRPVAAATGRVALRLEKYERGAQPRSHGPQ